MSPIAHPGEQQASDLCLDCGLCCNGVLFDLVMLQPGDHAKALSARGLKIKKGDRFNQPCTALCGVLCGIYPHRPARCRLFVCRQIQLVTAGESTLGAAGERIREAKEKVARVEALLETTGSSNPRKPLAHRYATVMGQRMAAVPEKTEAGEEVRDFGEPSTDSALVSAMGDLQIFLANNFRVP